MPAEEYLSWRETMYLLQSPANAAHLRHSIAEHRVTVDSRASRREKRWPAASAAFGASAEAALDLLELVDLAWHDCYGQVSPPDDVVEDILTVAQGRLDGLARAARLAVEDFRDLRLAATAADESPTAPG